tara:strand:- start:9001 stop:9468 length:468 start_codon:yes stop_codon:yes gene_type:complete
MSSKNILSYKNSKGKSKKSELESIGFKLENNWYELNGVNVSKNGNNIKLSCLVNHSDIVGNWVFQFKTIENFKNHLLESGYSKNVELDTFNVYMRNDLSLPTLDPTEYELEMKALIREEIEAPRLTKLMVFYSEIEVLFKMREKKLLTQITQLEI